MPSVTVDRLLTTLSTLPRRTSGNPGRGGDQRPVARYRLEIGPIPLHHQVYLDLKAAMDGNEYRSGDRLPAERELARRYGCSLITIRRALDELSREGRLRRDQGRGTFVLAPRLERDIAE